MQDNMKWNSICIIGIPEGEEEEQGIENFFEKVIVEGKGKLWGKRYREEEA